MSETVNTNETIIPQVTEPLSETNLEVQTEEVKNPLAEQFQRIAKQEKYNSAERAKIDTARKAMEGDKASAEAYKALQGKNPFEILEHFGISYDQLLQADKERSNPIDPKVREALQKVQELESKMTKKEREAEEATLARAEIQLKTDIDMAIKEKEYDLIEKLDAKDAVREYMEEMYDSTGVIPSIEEACEAITSHLVERVASVRESKWLRPKEEPKEELVEKNAPKQPSISNKMTQSTEFNKRPMNDQERLLAATAIFASSLK